MNHHSETNWHPYIKKKGMLNVGDDVASQITISDPIQHDWQLKTTVAMPTQLSRVANLSQPAVSLFSIFFFFLFTKQAQNGHLM